MLSIQVFFLLQKVTPSAAHKACAVSQEFSKAGVKIFFRGLKRKGIFGTNPSWPGVGPV